MNRNQRRLAKKSSAGSNSAALFALAVEHHVNNRLDDAERLYNEAISADKNNRSSSYNNLGLIFLDRGQVTESIGLFRMAIESNRNNGDAYNNLANALKKIDRFEESLMNYERSVRINPRFVNGYVNIGSLLRDTGKIDQAIPYFERAIRLEPNNGEAYLNLGNAYELLHMSKEAVYNFEVAISLMPESASAYNNLGSAILTQGKIQKSLDCLHKALAIKPDYPNAYLNMGNALTLLCRPEEAAECYEKVLAMEPGHVGALSNLLLTLNYMDMDPRVLAQRHFEVGSRIEAPFLQFRRKHENVRDIGRKLRIGYISPDLRNHAIVFFLEPLMKAHDRTAVEVFCYADVYRPDNATSRLQALSDSWLFTSGMTDQDLAEQIQADGIDILVDLAGHSANNRLPMFARKPAPIQVTWLGFPNTTGMTTIDFRLVDAVSDPPGEADAHASETLARLDSGFLCYEPPPEAPSPAPLPCLKTGTFTFGSFNNLAKLSPATFDAWGRLLNRLPTARLLIKSYLLADESARALCLARLNERGINSERVTLLEGIPDKATHLAAFHEVDVALDSLPYNGTTTTCDALWMGVPVVTLAGSRHAGRVGASLLTHVNLPELIARDISHYIDIAAGFAADPESLATLRAGLRERMNASPLCNRRAFARSVEKAYRAMWRQWCA